MTSRSSLALRRPVVIQSAFRVHVKCTLRGRNKSASIARIFIEVRREMRRNEHLQNDILYTMQPTRNILLALGAWPSLSKERSSVCPKPHNLLLISISYTLLSCDIIPGVLYWLMEETTRIRLQIIPFLLFDFMSVSQYGIFISRNDQLRRCLKHVEEDWENVLSADARNIMLKSARTGKRLVMICGAFMYSGAIIRGVLPLAQGKIVTDENVTMRRFAFPGYYFSLDVQVSPIYETVFALQCMSGLVTVSVVTGACGLTAIFVVHACGQLKILIGLMKSLVQKQWQEEHEIDNKLAEIVKHQIRIRNFLHLVQHTLQEIYLMEVLVNTITLCLLGYFMLLDWENRNLFTLLMYLISVMNIMMHIFLFCYTGEQLSSQAEKVATTSCELEWYRLPDRKARSIVLLMIMSNTPARISAGKVVDLSLKTFGDVVKTAGAYFNMLRNVVD